MNLVVRSLSHTFPGNPPRPALNNVSFQVESGQFVALIGPSGCGKSTLLRLVANLLRPVNGEISLNGERPELVIAKHQVAWMSQSPALLPWLTVKRNILLAQRFRSPHSSARFSADDVLRRVGLFESASAYPYMLSGGMQQRLALARILMTDATLWLMDEPFAALDELTREYLAQDLLQMWEPMRPTVLWITHNIYEALRLADRILVFSASPGRLFADIPVQFPRPRREFSEEFHFLMAKIRKILEENAFGAKTW